MAFIACWFFDSFLFTPIKIEMYFHLASENMMISCDDEQWNVVPSCAHIQIFFITVVCRWNALYKVYRIQYVLQRGLLVLFLLGMTSHSIMTNPTISSTWLLKFLGGQMQKWRWAAEWANLKSETMYRMQLLFSDKIRHWFWQLIKLFPGLVPRKRQYPMTIVNKLVEKSEDFSSRLRLMTRDRQIRWLGLCTNSQRWGSNQQLSDCGSIAVPTE